MPAKEVENIPGLTSNEIFHTAGVIRTIDSCCTLMDKGEISEKSRVNTLIDRAGHDAYKTIPPLQRRRMSREDNINWNIGVRKGVYLFIAGMC